MSFERSDTPESQISTNSLPTSSHSDSEGSTNSENSPHPDIAYRNRSQRKRFDDADEYSNSYSDTDEEDNDLPLSMKRLDLFDQQSKSATIFAAHKAKIIKIVLPKMSWLAEEEAKSLNVTAKFKSKYDHYISYVEVTPKQINIDPLTMSSKQNEFLANFIALYALINHTKYFALPADKSTLTYCDDDSFEINISLVLFHPLIVRKRDNLSDYRIDVFDRHSSIKKVLATFKTNLKGHLIKLDAWSPTKDLQRMQTNTTTVPKFVTMPFGMFMDTASPFTSATNKSRKNILPPSQPEKHTSLYVMEI